MPLTGTRFAAGVALGAALALASAHPALAEEDSPSMVYVFSIIGPALEPGCQEVLPGYADDFDRFYPKWREAKAQEIASARQALAEANADKDIAAIEEYLAGQAIEEFTGPDFAQRKKTCMQHIDYLASSAR